MAPGRAPARAAEDRIMGRAPVPGWQASYQWQGYLPFEDLPKIINPVTGALATANANWLPAGYSHHIAYDWEEPFRQ
jgi:penicillin amidase